MKNNKRTVISTIAASAILVSVFTFNSNALQMNTNAANTGNKPIEVTNTATNSSNIKSPVVQTVASALQGIKADSSKTLAPKAEEISFLRNSSNCPRARTTPANINSVINSSIPNALIINNQQTDATSLKAKLSELLKSYKAKIFKKANCKKQTTGSAAKQAAASTKATAAKPSAATKPASGATKTSSGTTSGTYSAFQKRVVELVNAERAKAGLKPLKMNAELSKVATLKSQDMVKNNYFDHNSPTYGSPFDMMRQFGISYSTAGENIAMGQTTPEQVMNGWMNSPGHRANILRSSFTEIGVGIAKDSNGRLYWTQEFIG